MQNSDFVANMERVLDVYKRPYDELYPVVCMDESPKQLIGETRLPIVAQPGSTAIQDYEYVRNGVCNVFVAVEPLTGIYLTEITERKTKIDWAKFMEKIAQSYPTAERITIVMDNLETHKPGSFYEAFTPKKAKALWNRFEFVYTPKHGSWLDMAEIGINLLMSQCLNRRIDNIEVMKREVTAWQEAKNKSKTAINWRFTTDNARIKLKRLYPTLQ